MPDTPCSMPEAHEGHMQMNGECPWCGATDESQIREPGAWDFPDAGTVDTS
jgi:hypothetical protein